MCSSVSGLVLETPFSCMRDEVATFRAARALVWSGAVDLDAALAEAGARFETCKWLPAVRCPVLILAGGALVSTICLFIIFLNFHFDVFVHCPLIKRLALYSYIA